MAPASARGYTVVELLVVVVLFGVVAVVTALALRHAVDKARQRATMADMRALSVAIESYAAEHGAPPAAEGSMADLLERLGPARAGDLPAFDHWNHAYSYSSVGPRGYRIESHGKDGVPGDDVTLATQFDFDRDIVLADGQFIAAPE